MNMKKRMCIFCSKIKGTHWKTADQSFLQRWLICRIFVAGIFFIIACKASDKYRNVTRGVDCWLTHRNGQRSKPIFLEAKVYTHLLRSHRSDKREADFQSIHVFLFLAHVLNHKIHTQHFNFKSKISVGKNFKNYIQY